MTGNTLEQRARELLAAEYERDERHDDARMLRDGLTCNAWSIALRAIEAALRLSAGTDGVGLIAAERHRQISAEGWTPAHDDEHYGHEMALAAAVYAVPGYEQTGIAGTRLRAQVMHLWPWEPEWFKPGRDDRVRDLVKAGALIAAEIDRLQRVVAPRHEPGEGITQRPQCRK